MNLSCISRSLEDGMKYFGICLLLATYSLTAQWDIELGAGPVYLKPSTKPFFIGEIDTTLFGVRRIDKAIDISPDANWGAEAYLRLDNQCQGYGFLARYTHLDTPTSITIDQASGAIPGGIVSVNVYPIGLVFDTVQAAPWKASFDYCYHTFVLRAERAGCLCCLPIHLYAGGRYVYIEGDRRYRALIAAPLPNTVILDYRDIHRFSGGGLDLGMTADLNVCRGIDLHAEFGGGFVVGVDKRRNCVINSALGTLPPFFTRSSVTVCAPTVQVRGSIRGCYQLGCIEIIGELGYMFEHYFAILRSRILSTPTSDERTDGICFCGPYATLGVKF